MELSHNVSEHEDTGKGGFKPIEPGDYTMMVVDFEMKPDSSAMANHGRPCFTLQFDERKHPQYKGRKVWHDMRLYHEAGEHWEKVRQIARGELSALCKACGIEGTMKDTNEVQLIPFVATLANREYQGKTYTEVKEYASCADPEAAEDFNKPVSLDDTPF